MIFKYTRFKPEATNLPREVYLPLLDVKLINGNYNILTRGLLDTGASITLINKAWAEALNIEWRKGLEASAYGIIGETVSIFIHDIEIEIPKLGNSRREVKVAFVDSANVGILLGQIGFFDTYNAAFAYSKRTFHVMLND